MKFWCKLYELIIIRSQSGNLGLQIEIEKINFDVFFLEIRERSDQCDGERKRERVAGGENEFDKIGRDTRSRMHNTGANENDEKRGIKRSGKNYSADKKATSK